MATTAMLATDVLRYRRGMDVAGLESSNIRQVAAFVAVAEELSFSKAAERLGLGQPPVSRLIARLERRLGVVLFERTSHSVHLTGAGAALLGPARRAVRAALDFDKAASCLAAGRGGTIRVGTTEGASTLLADVLAAYRRTHGDIDVVLEQAHTAAKLDAIRTGRLDVAFVRNPQPVPGVRTTPVWTEPLDAVVAADHPLAGRSSVSMVGLAEFPLLVTPRDVNPGVHDAVLALAVEAGFDPLLGPPFSNGPDAVALIASSNAWTLLSRQAVPAGAGVVGVPVTQSQAQAVITLAWRATGTLPHVAAFVEAARTLGRTTPPTRALRRGPPDG
jgi:DNA-binding transcriptional LysR family regulator